MVVTLCVFNSKTGKVYMDETLEVTSEQATHIAEKLDGLLRDFSTDLEITQVVDPKTGSQVYDITITARRIDPTLSQPPSFEQLFRRILPSNPDPSI
jgi:hypothetical protein